MRYTRKKKIIIIFFLAAVPIILAIIYAIMIQFGCATCGK